jgi:hypothetical protein
MFNTIVGAGAGAASNYGSDQMMRLLAAPAPQHCVFSRKTVKRVGEKVQTVVSILPLNSYKPTTGAGC